MDNPYFGITAKVDFTDLSHAGRMSKDQSIPRISTGKLVACGDRLYMSVSVELNHGLADGIHVGKFFSMLENL